MLASRSHWRLLAATILTLIVAAFLAPRLIPAPSIDENRVLAAKPTPPRRFADLHAYRQATDAYIADRFATRAYLIGALNRLRMLAGVSGSPRVLVGRNGWLFYDDGSHLGPVRNDPPMTPVEMRTWLMDLAARTESLQARGVRYLVVATPMKEAVYPQHAPAWYAGADPHRPALLLPKLAREAQAGDVLYLGPWVAQATQRGQKTYSRHDTHWTGYGAYAGYVGLMTRLRAMGLTDAPRPPSDFVRVRKSEKYTPRDLALMLGVASFVDIDYPMLRALHPPPPIRTTFLGAKRDWTAPQVVDTGAAGKPVLLMTRDSFSNALLPFLYPHFSRIILAHDQDGFWRQDLIDRFKPDIVVLEVVEAGLRFTSIDASQPSADAIARIDRALLEASADGELPTKGGAIMTPLTLPNIKTLAELARATPTTHCNMEAATLSVASRGQALLRVSGWISELGSTVTSPDGFVRLEGPGGVFVAPIKVDGARPDVAAAFKNPTGAASGFSGGFFARKLTPGAYSTTILRRSPQGWVACTGPQPLAVP